MKRDNGKNTKQRIFETAIDLFSRYGYNGVSIRLITRKVGIKESSLYNHFSGKSEILSAIFDYYQEEIRKMIPTEKEIRNLVSRYPADLFLESMLSQSKYYGTNPLMEKIFRIVTIEQYHNKRARDIMLIDMDELPRRSIEKALEIMVENNLIKEVDTRQITMQYFYVLQSLVAKLITLKSFGMSTDKVEKSMYRHAGLIYETVRKQVEQ